MSEELTLEEAENIVDNMYKNRWKECGVEEGNTIHMENLSNLKYNELESASILLLRTEIRLKREIKKLQQENQELKEKQNYDLKWVLKYDELYKENQSLKKQLEYLRSGEYLNQLRFERDMLQDLVDKKEISKEDKEFIDMTHRNTELLEQQKEFIEYLENKIEKNCNSKNMSKCNIFQEILSKYKEIIGGKDE